MAQLALRAERRPRRDSDDEVLLASAQRPSAAGQAQPAAEARVLERRRVGRAGSPLRTVHLQPYATGLAHCAVRRGSAGALLACLARLAVPALQYRPRDPRVRGGP